MEEGNIAKSATTECHYIGTIVRTVLCNQMCFANAHFQCHPLPIHRDNWLRPHGMMKLAHGPKQLRHWQESLRQTE